MINTILFPSDYFDVNKVDEDLLDEYNAVSQLPNVNIILFSYDDWFNNHQLKLNKKIDHHITAIYRGWMMSADMYNEFYHQLSNNNITLITKPEAYELLHLFPNMYPYIEVDTAKILTYSFNEMIDVDKIKSKFNKFMVKDYVKSVKGSSFPKYFDETITQDEFDNWMKVFYEYRGNLLTAGICIKEYLNLKKYDNKTNEYRVFYVNHHVLSISKNSNQCDNVNCPPIELINKYKNINSLFYTIDFAELDNDEWKIIECGDGQVSGLSFQQDYKVFYKNLFNSINS